MQLRRVCCCGQSWRRWGRAFGVTSLDPLQQIFELGRQQQAVTACWVQAGGSVLGLRRAVRGRKWPGSGHRGDSLGVGEGGRQRRGWTAFAPREETGWNFLLLTPEAPITGPNSEAALPAAAQMRGRSHPGSAQGRKSKSATQMRVAGTGGLRAAAPRPRARRVAFEAPGR
jgi:hypothetical protein